MTEKQGNNNIESITDTIIGNQNITIEIPLIDLIWTIVIFSDKMVDLEDKIFNGNFTLKEKRYFIRQKEYYACRRDELSRIINQYSDFDTQRIWKEVDKMFKVYNTGDVE